MSERMRSLRREAIDALTQLAAQFGTVEVRRVQQHYAVHVDGQWYDAGTVEGALQLAGRAALDCAAGNAGEVPASRATETDSSGVARRAA